MGMLCWGLAQPSSGFLSSLVSPHHSTYYTMLLFCFLWNVLYRRSPPRLRDTVPSFPLSAAPSAVSTHLWNDGMSVCVKSTCHKAKHAVRPQLVWAGILTILVRKKKKILVYPARQESGNMREMVGSWESPWISSKSTAPGAPCQALGLCPIPPSTCAAGCPGLATPVLALPPTETKGKCFIKQTQHLLRLSQGLRQAWRNRQYLPSPCPARASWKVILAKYAQQSR